MTQSRSADTIPGGRRGGLRRVAVMLVLGMAIGTAGTLLLVGAARRGADAALESDMRDRALRWEREGRPPARGAEGRVGATSSVSPR